MMNMKVFSTMGVRFHAFKKSLRLKWRLFAKSSKGNLLKMQHHDPCCYQVSFWRGDSAVKPTRCSYFCMMSITAVGAYLNNGFRCSQSTSALDFWTVYVRDSLSVIRFYFSIIYIGVMLQLLLSEDS